MKDEIQRLKMKGEIQLLKIRLSENIDRQQVLAMDINRGNNAKEEYERLEKQSKEIILALAEIVKTQR